MGKFVIDIVDLYWIDGEKENPEDLCLHGEVNVTIGGETLIDIDEYTKVVFDFADKIEVFYKSCKEKVLPDDDFDREGYIKFWREWNNRRHKNFLI
ncbi:MAG: hypothetical protein MR593_04425 [Intestinibacter sp.]|nr:hypothetical protein [Intestinibacter sp.]